MNNLPTEPSSELNLHTQMKDLGEHFLSALGALCRCELGHADVCAKFGRLILCLEIEQAVNAHVLVNLSRNFQQGAEFVLIACSDFHIQAGICRLLDRALTQEDRKRVSVVTFSLIDFLTQVPISGSKPISQPSAGNEQLKP